MDADLSTDLSEISRFLGLVSGADILIGVRDSFRTQRTRGKKYLGILSRRCIKSVLGLSYADTQCGFKLFHAKTKYLRSSLINQRRGFDFEILYKAKIHGYTIDEFPVKWTDKTGSKVKLLDYFSTFFDLLKTRYMYSTCRTRYHTILLSFQKNFTAFRIFFSQTKPLFSFIKTK